MGTALGCHAFMHKLNSQKLLNNIKKTHAVISKRFLNNNFFVKKATTTQHNIQLTGLIKKSSILERIKNILYGWWPNIDNILPTNHYNHAI